MQKLYLTTLPFLMHFHWTIFMPIILLLNSWAHKWNIAKRPIWLLVFRECQDDACRRLRGCLWRTWVGCSGGVSYHISCNWPAFMTVEKAFLGLYSQTRRMMLITPLQTKVLDLFMMLTSLACPIMRVTGLLSFSLSDLAAFHRGRKTPMSFFVPEIIRRVHTGKTLHLIFLVRRRLKYILLLRKRGAGLNAVMRF